MSQRINFQTIQEIMRQFDFPTQVTITKNNEDGINESYTVDVYHIIDYPTPVAECVYSATFDPFTL